MTDTTMTPNAIALLRVTSGALLLTHGLTKVFLFTPAGTASYFESIGFAGILAYPVMAGEIALGLALIAGFLTRWAALGALMIMIGAIVPHISNGFSFSNPGGGWEYPVFWSVALAAQALLGDGAFSLGNPFVKRT